MNLKQCGNYTVQINEGLAIQTTYRKLVESVIEQKDDYVGLIKYLDYEIETFRDENIKPNNAQKESF